MTHIRTRKLKKRSTNPPQDTSRSPSKIQALPVDCTSQRTISGNRGSTRRNVLSLLSGRLDTPTCGTLLNLTAVVGELRSIWGRGALTLAPDFSHFAHRERSPRTRRGRRPRPPFPTRYRTRTYKNN